MKWQFWLGAGAMVASVGSAGFDVVWAQDFTIPKPIASGHEALYSEMEAATRAGGQPGEAARAAMAVLGPHFQKEEQYALPQLGLLPGLVGSPLAVEAQELTPEQRQELRMRTERFRAELPQMFEEHARIGAALEELRKAAEEEGKTEHARLAEEIGVHARTEEQVLYPTALLIGDLAQLQDGSAQ